MASPRIGCTKTGCALVLLVASLWIVGMTARYAFICLVFHRCLVALER